MFNFENCWKCEEENEVEILSKWPIGLRRTVCDNSKRDRCMKKYDLFGDNFHGPKRGNKAQRTLLDLYFHHHDIDTNMDRRKYKNIIKRSNNPCKQVMKNEVVQCVALSVAGDGERLPCGKRWKEVK